MHAMDAEWFKSQQRLAGVTSSDIGERLGRDRTIVARIYAGKQQMTYQQAEVFAEILGAALDDVLSHAGLRARRAAPSGMSEGDVVAFDRGAAQSALDRWVSEMAKGQRPGVDVWRVRTGAMRLAGYLPGDWILVDTHAAGRAVSGDTVIAQVYDLATGTARTLLRQMQKPALISHSCQPDDWAVQIVDDSTVLVRGVVIASWRVAQGALSGDVPSG